RYRKEVAGQVKSALLMASLEQLDEDHKLKPITQPDLDVEAIELPDDGPMRYEMDLEVEPDFALPEYKALRVKRPVKAVEDADVDAQYKRFLEGYAQIVPKLEGGAEIGDYVTADVTLEYEGVIVNRLKEMQIRLQPVLQFQDGQVPGLGEALTGARPGDTREAEVRVGSSSSDAALRGKSVRGIFHVLDLKQPRLPEVDQAFLRSVGFESAEDLRSALRGMLERRFRFQQQQAIRRELLDKLVS